MVNDDDEEEEATKDAKTATVQIKK